MIKGIALLFVFIIVIAVIVMGISIATSDGTWSSPMKDDDGTETEEISNSDWGQEIILEYEDGTLQSLKPQFDNPILGLYDTSGNKINGIYYILKAKASGGPSSVKIDITNYRYDFKLNHAATFVYTKTMNPNFFYSNPKITVSADGSWQEVFKIHSTVDEMGANSVEDGTYDFYVVPTGSLKYSIDNGQTWNTANVPGDIAFTINIEGGGGGGQFVISFGNGYSTHG